jgi:DHA2 family multidrug resistance protein
MGIGIPLFFIPLNQIYLSGLPTGADRQRLRPGQLLPHTGSSVSTAITVTLWQHRTELPSRHADRKHHGSRARLPPDSCSN